MNIFTRLVRCLFKQTKYVSEADKFLHEFDKANPGRSLSQRQEIAKHHNIFKRSGTMKW